MKSGEGRIWMDGRLVPWAEATLHVTSEAVQRGANVFEGLRAYADNQRKLNLFRFADHVKRLRQSARIMRMPIPYDDETLLKGTRGLLVANGVQGNIHLRMTAYFDMGAPYAWRPDAMTTRLSIFATDATSNPKLLTGIRSGISTWRRNSDDSSPSRVKAAANYHNSRLAQVEANLRGFDVPVMLNARGKVAESPSSCFFMVRDDQLITPPVTADILESITRDTILTLYREQFGKPAIERDIDRTEILICDEAFFCGSSHELLPIVSIDDYELGDGGVGPVTAALQRLYFDVVAARRPDGMGWLTPVRPDALEPC